MPLTGIYEMAPMQRRRGWVAAGAAGGKLDKLMAGRPHGSWLGVVMRKLILAGACALAIAPGAASALSFTYTYDGATIQSWTVPISGVYAITAYGAQGGGQAHYGWLGGNGAEVGGDIRLTAGTVLNIVVGGVGEPGVGIRGAAGGGGGAFVYEGLPPARPLLVAGGGGGAADLGGGGAGHAGTSGEAGSAHSGIGGAGGANGSGGSNAGGGGGGGAGWFGNGAGLEGGSGPPSFSGGQGFSLAPAGGFGGGGGPGGTQAGGGGGYSGGGGGVDPGYAGGGGGSYIGAAFFNTTAQAGFNSGDGSVFIELIPPSQVIGAPEPGSWTLMILGVGLVGGVMRTRREAAPRLA